MQTYVQLQQSISTWLKREDLSAEIQSFIVLAEADLRRRFRCQRMLTKTTLTVDGERESLPSDWLATKSLRLVDTVGQAFFLEYVTQEELDQMGLASSVTGLPRYFTHEGESFVFSPVPDTAYTAHLIYYKALPALSDAAPTNWLLTESPDLYLYGALKHAQPYLMDDQRWAGFSTQYEAALREAQRAGHVDTVSGTPAPSPRPRTTR
jgi:hypothetical protein